MPDSTSIQTTDSVVFHPVYVPKPVDRSYDAPSWFVADGGINTVIVDSIATDTVEGRIPHFIPIEQADSLEAVALAEELKEETIVLPPPSGLEEGIAPYSLPAGYTHSTPLTMLMVGILVVAALNAPSLGRALKGYRSELWSVRGRLNVFDEESAVRLPFAVLLGLIFVVFGGIVLYNCPVLPEFPSFAGVSASMALLGVYYIFQRCAYGMVGYAFGTPDQCHRFVGGFDATQAYAGLGMVIPALLMVCRPDWHDILLIISISIYEVFHMIFIIKGFRIFYQKITSLLYFILYLCTLEIIPQLVLYRLSIVMSAAV